MCLVVINGEVKKSGINEMNDTIELAVLLLEAQVSAHQTRLLNAVTHYEKSHYF